MQYYSVIYGIIGALLALFMMYLDTKIMDNPKERGTYIKNMIMTGLAVAAVVYLIGEETLQGHKIGGLIGGGGAAASGLVNGLSYVPGINEEIMTGTPNF